MTPPKIEFPAELMAEARRLYEDTTTPVHEIAAMMGVSEQTFRSRLREWGWKRRRHPTRALDLLHAVRGATVAAATAPGEPQAAIAPLTPERRAALAARIVTVIERHMDALERVLAAVQPKDQGEAERSTRVLRDSAIALRETAALLQSDPVNAPDEADDDSLPRDIDEFRAVLAQRIRMFIDARQRGDGRADDSSGAVSEGEGMQPVHP